MEEWEISKPLGLCSGTEKEIAPGEEYIGALVETSDGLQRRDYCLDYWFENKPSVYCHWKTKIPLPDQKKRLFVDDEMLMAFFERLENETDTEKLNFRFVLTLVLMRKRKLKYDSTRMDDDKEIWRLKVTGTDDYAEVLNPQIDEEQIEQLSSQIGQILHTEL
ncbi:MAG: hypothetical protein ACYTFM_07550 [Planctomycetota bacterium]|jgi:hypothetical protein